MPGTPWTRFCRGDCFALVAEENRSWSASPQPGVLLLRGLRHLNEPRTALGPVETKLVRSEMLLEKGPVWDVFSADWQGQGIALAGLWGDSKRLRRERMGWERSSGGESAAGPGFGQQKLDVLQPNADEQC